MKIVPETLRRLRKESGLSQQGLADRARVDKKTVARIEGGKGGEARQGTALDIARALGVEPRVLAAQPASEAMEDRELQRHGYVGAKVHFRGGTVLAYDLVRDRYGVDMWEVIDAAPFLFALLAEMSLADRRRRLEEMVAAWETYQTTVPEHIGFAAVGDCNEGMLAEKDSIAERDLSGVHILRENEPWSMYVDNNNREYYDQDRTPFSDFLIKLAKELGPDNDAIDYHGIMSALGDGGGMIGWELFPTYLKRLTGGSPRADYALSHGYVRLTQIPKHLRGEDDNQVSVERTEWLEAHVPDEDWAKRSRILDSTSLHLERSEPKEGDENVGL